MNIRRLKPGLGARGRVTIFISSALIAATLCAVTVWAMGGQGESATPGESPTAAATETLTPAPAEDPPAPTPDASQTSPPEVSGASTTSASPGQAVHKPTLRFWLHPDGIRPRLMRASPGRVVLRLENETGEDVALVVQRVLPGGEIGHVGRVAIRDRGRRARGEAVLTAGEYVFFDEARPLLTGRLMVEPRQ